MSNGRYSTLILWRREVFRCAHSGGLAQRNLASLCSGAITPSRLRSSSCGGQSRLIRPTRNQSRDYARSRVQISRNDTRRRCASSHNTSRTHRKALQQRYAADVAQFRVVAQHARQPVIGNAAAEVMHVVNADVGREPAQQRRQFVM